MLLFARHGNTFGKGETPRMVGAHEDLPLTEEGREQARRLGLALKQAGVELHEVRAGPLSRTLDFARIAAAAAGLRREVCVDERLRELDYGDWAGLTDAGLVARFGQASVDAWRLRGEAPVAAGWKPDADAVRASLSGLATDSREGTLCVTSNGLLRYVMDLDRQAFAARGADGGFRVQTGRLCAFRRVGETLKLVLWNAAPDAEVFKAAAGAQ